MRRDATTSIFGSSKVYDNGSADLTKAASAASYTSLCPKAEEELAVTPSRSHVCKNQQSAYTVGCEANLDLAYLGIYSPTKTRYSLVG
jgi:hypothetical protein